MSEVGNIPMSNIYSASRTMDRMSFKVDNYSFASNVYWCRFSYNGIDTFNYAFHSHSYYEIHYCIQGEATFVLKSGERINIKKDEFVIFPMKLLHSLEFVSDDFAKLVFGFDITVKESDEKNFIKSAFNNINPKSLASTEEMKIFSEMILNQAKKKLPVYRLAINELLELLIIEISRVLNDDKHVETESYGNEDFRLEAIVRFMRDNVLLNLSASDIAREMNLSVKQLNRLMKSAYGMSVAEFFRIERVKAMKNLLSDTDMSLHDIAEKMEFSDEFSMSKTFKNIVGMTPGRYRKYYHK